MPPSKRKRTEKQKDFRKAKLRVGKTNQPNANATDTSFTAKTISLPSQSINSGPKTDTIDYAHQFSLLKHHSNVTRKEIVLYLKAHIPASPTVLTLLITNTIPLILDQSKMVRAATVELLTLIQTEKPESLGLFVSKIMLFIHSAMTHIQPNVRNDSTKFLNILLMPGGITSAVVIKEHWNKTLKLFCQLLDWSLEVKLNSVAINNGATSLASSDSKKARIGHLNTLSRVLALGFVEDHAANKTDEYFNAANGLHPLTNKYLMCTTAQPFASLKLFAREMASTSSVVVGDGKYTLKDLDSVSSEDYETRIKLLKDIFYKHMARNLHVAVKEGGDVGREGKNVLSFLKKLEEQGDIEVVQPEDVEIEAYVL
ncbi:hypothetical protein BABINDRAFT_58382 [Babjeviella inositovora NRRL Y-12698]|uniref:Pre-rRNA-processing protein n=1 Tax=Babjeviella inositovora NRRL Y-12698 TaxID=984486 RepID=A0A1E3QVR4_9ASCO|nr:uncharacterized protein BABINDRAFT_58382 [Babjeviella inositovora NRRL Y-12698]ODQ81748.1 hypothetical protein BABINDRAFT_58382 [Babjeviella inositovora NRRL Y-12698]